MIDRVEQLKRGSFPTSKKTRRSTPGLQSKHQPLSVLLTQTAWQSGALLIEGAPLGSSTSTSKASALHANNSGGALNSSSDFWGGLGQEGGGAGSTMASAERWGIGDSGFGVGGDDDDDDDDDDNGAGFGQELGGYDDGHGEELEERQAGQVGGGGGGGE